MKRSLGREAVRAAAIVIAMLGSFCTVFVLALRFSASTSPAILAAILTLSLARRAPEQRALHWSLFPFSVAAVGVVAGLEGLLLHALPLAGAAVFVAAVFLSVYLRNFDHRASAVGTLVALPFVSMLVVPFTPSHGPHRVPLDLALVACAGFVALAFATLAQRAGERAGVRIAARAAAPKTARPKRENELSAPTRMALQMAVALTLAFAAGFTVFRGHWAWLVLTAFIVCSGAAGRADALWKAVLRLLGALGGTATATLAIHIWRPRGIAEAAGIFAVIFIGLWLRDANYAYWAACMTLVFALLAGTSDAAPLPLLFVRLAGVFVGAVCAVVATWFVFPIRTVHVVRRRLADALLALDDFVANAHVSHEDRESRYATFEHRMSELERVAVPLRVHRRLFASADHAEHPGRWIDAAAKCHGALKALGSRPLEPERRGSIRRAIGQTRKAIGAYGSADAPPAAPGVSESLDTLHRTLGDARP